MELLSFNSSCGINTRCCCSGPVYHQVINYGLEVVPYDFSIYPIWVARHMTLPVYKNRRLREMKYVAGCSAQSELFFRLLLKNTVRWVHSPAYPIFWNAPHGAHQPKSKLHPLTRPGKTWLAYLGPRNRNLRLKYP
ncbi:hypothetical protein KC19_3G172100 [Ceratodon purpureus]|uniref:Uncharacterized protein n=1 Tax=Ceratodon purpureus TaxID=3225 RepID=A0A8T0IL00_CERPU|nr:hypothetical protein KC19_3G172100 [Ceratodon purpureus]